MPLNRHMRSILLITSLFILSVNAIAEEFSIVQHNYNISGKEFGSDTIYVKDDRMRIETTRSGKLVTISFYDAGKKELIQLDKRTDTAETFDLEDVFKNPFAAYQSHFLAAYYFRAKFSNLQKIEAIGEESVEGEILLKYRMPLSPFAKENGPEVQEYIWVSQATGLPVKHQLTLGAFRTLQTLDGYTPGPQPDSLFELPENAMKVPTTPKMQFALTNREGTRLLVTGDIADPVAAVRAVCENSRQYPIRYLKKQESDPEHDTHRQNVYNFQYTEGHLYEFTDGAAPDQSCLVAPAGFFKERNLIPVRTNSIQQKLPACHQDDISRMVIHRDRKVEQCAVLLDAGDRFRILALEFERRPEDILAAVVLLRGDEILSWDLPGREDKYSVWRVDDGGIFRPEYIRVMFAFEHQSRIELGIEWLGAEATTLRYLIPMHGRFFEYIKDGWYQAPI
jgi:outer membrane lipoprotein-sorting protein